MNVVTGQAPGDPHEIVAEVVAEQGERGLAALTEAGALLLALAVEELVAVLDDPEVDVPARVVGVFEAYGEEAGLLPHLPALLAAAGGATLVDQRALADVVEAAGVTAAFPVGLAKTAGMVLRLVELVGTPLEGLLEGLEERILTVP
ncbi:hypothetical protein [Streptomyces sp. NBC_00207]|uniref:hypothetical protein n=1 Tax=unclassified Streptomyces TaxID=2593676 RepID=UPI00288642F0|nr:hypothetical protein [Streptomyces sp. DSM 41633]